MYGSLEDLEVFIGVKDGIYRHIPAEVLGAQVLKEIKNRFSLKDEEIDYIIGGNAVAGGGKYHPPCCAYSRFG